MGNTHIRGWLAKNETGSGMVQLFEYLVFESGEEDDTAAKRGYPACIIVDLKKADYVEVIYEPGSNYYKSKDKN